MAFLENLNCTSDLSIQSPELQRHIVWFLVVSSSQEWQSVSWNFGKVQTFVLLWHLTYSCPNQDLHPVSEIKCNQKFYHRGPQHVGFKPLILKVHIYWEDHKILRNLHLKFDYSQLSETLQRPLYQALYVLQTYFRISL